VPQAGRHRADLPGASPPAAVRFVAVKPGLLGTSNRAVPASSEIVKRSGHHLLDIG